MAGNIGLSISIAGRLILGLLKRPAWFIAIFFFLACLIPFAGPTASLRGDSLHILDPFGFSLLTPSRHAFGPTELLALAILFLVPAALVDFGRTESRLRALACPDSLNENTLALAAFGFYGFFLILAFPLLARSHAFPGPVALGLAMLDLLLRAAAMGWVISFALGRTGNDRLKPLICWIVAGAFHLAMTVTDALLIAPQARELVETNVSTLIWHGLIALVAVTLHALPLPTPKARATL